MAESTPDEDGLARARPQTPEGFAKDSRVGLAVPDLPGEDGRVEIRGEPESFQVASDEVWATGDVRYQPHPVTALPQPGQRAQDPLIWSERRLVRQALERNDVVDGVAWEVEPYGREGVPKQDRGVHLLETPLLVASGDQPVGALRDPLDEVEQLGHLDGGDGLHPRPHLPVGGSQGLLHPAEVDQGVRVVEHNRPHGRHDGRCYPAPP